VIIVIVLRGRVLFLLMDRSERSRLAGLMVVGVGFVAVALSIFDSVLRMAPTIVLISVLVGLALGDGEVAAGLSSAERSRTNGKIKNAIVVAIITASYSFARSAMQDLNALRIV